MNGAGTAAAPATASLIAAREVSVTFGAISALRDIGFELMPGEARGLVGENPATPMRTPLTVPTAVVARTATAKAAATGR